jgi:hypothetical protein
MSMRAIAVVTLLLAAPTAAQAFNYVEATDGDVESDDENAPTALGSLDAGANVLSGTATAGTDWGDVFSVEVPLGLEIASIAVGISAHTGGFSSVTKVFETPVYFSLDSRLFPADDSYSYTTIVPLAAPGPYAFTAAFDGADVGESYAWQWTITAPEPEAGALSLTAGALLLLAAALDRRDTGARRARARRRRRPAASPVQAP